MERVTETDFKFLWRLSSLYEALIHSAVDPVVLDKSEMKEFGGIYYDAYNNQTKAIKIMKNRMLFGRNDIIDHRKFHESFLNKFYDIDEFINTNNRTKVGDVVDLLCNDVSDYLSFVYQHHLILSNDYFLYYPSCPTGHYFQIPKSDIKIIPQLEFNPKKTKKGGGIYLAKIKRVIPNFKLGKDKIPSMRVASQEDSGDGIIDNSLRGRIELNNELLRRVGFY